MRTDKEYKDLTINELAKAAAIYETDHAGIYEMCKDDYPYIKSEWLFTNSWLIFINF